MLAVVVHYFDTDKKDIVDALLDTVTVETGSAHNLYQNLLLKRSIPWLRITLLALVGKVVLL